MAITATVITAIKSLQFLVNKLGAHIRAYFTPIISNPLLVDRGFFTPDREVAQGQKMDLNKHSFNLFFIKNILKYYSIEN